MQSMDFSSTNILVIGDIILDQYIYGTVTRTSPEANVPVVLQNSMNSNLGGAGNVAINLRSLGANTFLLGGIGSDKEGEKILSHLKESLQDYNKGILTSSSIPRIIKSIQKENIPYVVDPKVENFFAYKEATLFKPNLKELKSAFPDQTITTNSLRSISQVLREKIKSKYNLITLGGEGLFLDNKDEACLLPAKKIDKPDVCGAGDAVISLAALAIAKNMTIKEIAEWSNKAGFLACTKIGVHPILLDEFLNCH